GCRTVFLNAGSATGSLTTSPIAGSTRTATSSPAGTVDRSTTAPSTAATSSGPSPRSCHRRSIASTSTRAPAHLRQPARRAGRPPQGDGRAHGPLVGPDNPRPLQPPDASHGSRPGAWTPSTAQL